MLYVNLFHNSLQLELKPKETVMPPLKKVRELIDMLAPQDGCEGCKDCRILKELINSTKR